MPVDAGAADVVGGVLERMARLPEHCLENREGDGHDLGADVVAREHSDGDVHGRMIGHVRAVARGQCHRSGTITTGELTWSPPGVVAVKKNTRASAGGDARVIAIAPQ